MLRLAQVSQVLLDGVNTWMVDLPALHPGESRCLAIQQEGLLISHKTDIAL